MKLSLTGNYIITGIDTKEKYDALMAELKRQGFSIHSEYHPRPDLPYVRLEGGSVKGYGRSDYSRSAVNNTWGGYHMFVTYEEVMHNPATSWVETSERLPTLKDVPENCGPYSGYVMVQYRNNGTVGAARWQNVSPEKHTQWLSIVPPELPKLPVTIKKVTKEYDGIISPDGKTLDVGCQRTITFEKVTEVYQEMKKLQEIS